MPPPGSIMHIPAASSRYGKLLADDETRWLSLKYSNNQDPLVYLVIVLRPCVGAVMFSGPVLHVTCYIKKGCESLWIVLLGNLDL